MPHSAAGELDLNRLIDEAPWSLLQKAIIFFTALAIIFDGMDVQMMGFAIPSMAKEWGVARSSFSSILAFGLIGVACGTAVGGFLGDRIGRKKMLLYSMVLFGGGTWAIAFSHSLSALFIMRFVAGLGIGAALPNATTITAESLPSTDARSQSRWPLFVFRSGVYLQV